MLLQVPVADSWLLDQGVLGFVVLILLSAVAYLFKANQALHQAQLENQKEMAEHYRQILVKSVEQQSELQSTLDKLGDGLSARELLIQLIEPGQRFPPLSDRGRE